MTGSLEHNSRHHPRPNNGNGNLDYHQSTSTFGPQANHGAGGFDTQNNTVHSIDQHYRDEFKKPTSPPNPPNSPLVDLPYQNHAPEPFVPQPPRPEPKKPRSPQEIAASDEMSIKEALDWKRVCKSTKTEAIGINKRLRKHLYGRDHVSKCPLASALI
jgi:hypothetical protein